MDQLTRIPVRDVMQTSVVTISASDRLSTVEDIMTLGRVRHMPVVHAGKLVGVVSERDLLRAHPEYADYRNQVPMLLPRVGGREKAAADREAD